MLFIVPYTFNSVDLMSVFVPDCMYVHMCISVVASLGMYQFSIPLTTYGLICFGGPGGAWYHMCLSTV